MSGPLRPIRVLVAEDSATVRQLLIAILSSDPEFHVVGEAANGTEAVRKAHELAPDLITMDVHMPELDGIDATKAIMRESPTPILVVTATGSRDDVELSMNAMQAGALMVVDKPVDPNAPQFTQQRAQLLSMAKAMAGVKVVRRWSGGMSSQISRASAVHRTVQMIAIGTSTGGPAALHRILIDLPRRLSVPILVVQHIARGFVDGLAHWLGLNCALPVQVATDQAQLLPGVVYLAPDDHHLGPSADGRVRLSTAPSIGGFRPSVDHLFESCGRVYGGGALGVILTGMGRDGVDGLRSLHGAGGWVIAQDEATSVVYGMAQEAVRAGVVNEVLPIENIGSRLKELVS